MPGGLRAGSAQLKFTSISKYIVHNSQLPEYDRLHYSRLFV